MEEKQKEQCTHYFEVRQITQEPIGLGGANMEKVAYVVCVKCGKVKREHIS